jgi:Zn-dependent protease
MLVYNLRMEQVIIIIALIFSIILHEMAHGYAANALGDPTARLQGRLSANPLVHIDILGSLIIPAFLFFSQAGLLFGWAKPVPYNPYNLRNQKWGEALVAAAGPATNVILAVIFSIIIRSAAVLDIPDTFLQVSMYIVYINILLAMFNMLPIPPLDGSKILMAFLPFGLQQKYRQFAAWVERYGLFAMFAFIFIFITYLSDPFFIVVSSIVELATGIRMN